MINALRDSTEGAPVTALYDTIVTACSGEMARPATRQFRRAIILFSDGQDNYSISSLSDAIAALHETDVVIYVITARGRHWHERGQSTLTELTAATGGRSYVLRRPVESIEAVKMIENELRSSYTVSFHPMAVHDGQFHRVQIALHDHNLEVHARPGYYAPSR
jgi:VWFA-related protein